MLRNTPSRQAGVNLVELMVGIAVSLILMAGVITLILRVSVSGGESVQSTRLNQQMRGTLDQINKELQRAGYVDWYDAWDSDDCDGNRNGTLEDVNGDGEVTVLDFYECAVPAIDTFGEVQTANLDDTDCTSDCACVLYRYDRPPGNGVLDDDERLGFKLENGTIFMRTGGNSASCADGDWEAMTDSNVTITDLGFSVVYVDDPASGDATSYRYEYEEDEESGVLIPPTDLSPRADCTPEDDNPGQVLPGDGDELCLWRRAVAITMRGELADDSDVTAQLGTSDDPVKVKIKNDYFNTAP